MTYHPDVLAAHAQFGGDLNAMQALYDRPDHLARIADLRADKERLERERDEFRNCLATTSGRLMAAEADRDRLAAENAAIEAERDRLVAALKEIARGCEGRVDLDHLACRVARAALDTAKGAKK